MLPRGSIYYRLDKSTGAVELIDGKTMTNVVESGQEGKGLDVVHDWGEQSVPGRGIKIRLATKWRDGEILYRAQVSPFDSLRFLRYGATFTFAPVDRDQFELMEIKVDLSDAVTTVSEKGVPEFLSKTGTEQLSAEKYRAMTGYTFGWSGL
jgi:hypothetical protein